MKRKSASSYNVCLGMLLFSLPESFLPYSEKTPPLAAQTCTVINVRATHSARFLLNAGRLQHTCFCVEYKHSDNELNQL